MALVVVTVPSLPYEIRQIPVSGTGILTSEPQGDMYTAMPFGKYRGWDLSEIPHSYLEWLRYRSDIPLRGWLRQAIDDELGGRQGWQRDRQDSWSSSSSSSSSSSMACPNRDIAGQIISAGHHVLARQHHPDVGGQLETMKTVNAVADWLKHTLLGASR